MADPYGNEWDDAAQAWREPSTGRYFADGQWFDSLARLQAYRRLVGGGGDSAEPNIITQTSGGVTRGIDKNTGAVLWETPTGGGSTSVSVSIPPSEQTGAFQIQTDAQGNIYRINKVTGAVDVIGQKEVPGTVNPADRNNDGLDDSTNLALGVFPSAASPSGFFYDPGNGDYVPVTPSGAPYSGARITPEPAGSKRSTGLVQLKDGSDVLIDTQTGDIIKVIGPGSASSSYGGGGGGSDPMSSMITAQINAQARAASDAASAARQAASAQAAAEARAAEDAAAMARQDDSQNFTREENALNRALQAGQFAANYNLNRQQALDARKEARKRLAETYAQVVGSADPAQYAAFMAEYGAIANGLQQGGNALSTAALRPGAIALGELRTPDADIPEMTVESLLGGSRPGGQIGLGASGPASAPSAPASQALDQKPGSAITENAVNSYRTADGQIHLKPGWSPVSSMQSVFDFTEYGGPRVDIGDQVRGAMTWMNTGSMLPAPDAAGDPRFAASAAADARARDEAQQVAAVNAGANPTSVVAGIDRTTGGMANPFASLPQAQVDALLAAGGLAPGVAEQLRALPRRAMGGPADEPFILVGEEGPEIIANPLRAPLDVMNNEQTQIMLGQGMRPPGYALGTYARLASTAAMRTSPTTTYTAPAPVYTPPPPVYVPPPQPVYTPPPPVYTPPPPPPAYRAPAPAPIPVPPPMAALSAPPPAPLPAPAPAPKTTGPALVAPPSSLAAAPSGSPSAPLPAPRPATAPVSTPQIAVGTAPAPTTMATAPQAAPAAVTATTATTPVATASTAAPAPQIQTGTTANTAAPQITVGNIAQSPNLPADPSDQFMQDVLNQRLATQYPNLNYLDVGYFGVDPLIRKQYQLGLQATRGIPADSIAWEAQRYAIPGATRGAIRLGL